MAEEVMQLTRLLRLNAKWSSTRMVDKTRIPVLDLFAGPGGLGEGFSQCRVGNRRQFSIALSVEMEQNAHRTLRLRSFYRQFDSPSKVPAAFYGVLRGEMPPEALANHYPDQWEAAEFESLCATLGTDEGDAQVFERLDLIKKDIRERVSVLIGGPPCQAYSLVGRARNRGIEGYVAEQDHRHRLYLEYLRTISRMWPAVFVMENVKGILSSRLNSEKIFPKILEDLEDPLKALGQKGGSRKKQRYKLIPVTAHSGADGLFDAGSDPAAFITRCEEFGVPQCRHRVFIVGLREDLAEKGKFEPLARNTSDQSTVRDVLEGLPKLRSGLSPRGGITGDWNSALRSALKPKTSNQIEVKAGKDVRSRMSVAIQNLEASVLDRGAEFVQSEPDGVLREKLGKWLVDPKLDGVCNHSTRSHMDSDLARYLFASSYAAVNGVSPTLSEFPQALMPNHQNAQRAAKDRSLFADRFRVQVWDRPATTVTSHISKDGHYFIHPDPEQCRSLTVREAARLQTFPDNYFFCGPRTSQYAQVGNAVPPYMASQIAERVHGFLKSSGCL